MQAIADARRLALSLRHYVLQPAADGYCLCLVQAGADVQDRANAAEWPQYTLFAFARTLQCLLVNPAEPMGRPRKLAASQPQYLPLLQAGPSTPTELC